MRTRRLMGGRRNASEKKAQWEYVMEMPQREYRTIADALVAAYLTGCVGYGDFAVVVAMFVEKLSVYDNFSSRKFLAAIDRRTRAKFVGKVEDHVAA